jgi:hypothetical protein
MNEEHTKEKTIKDEEKTVTQRPRRYTNEELTKEENIKRSFFFWDPLWP